MTAEDLIKELGNVLGTPMELSSEGTCRVAFDSDEVDFQKVDEDLYVIADLGSAENREDASNAMLAGNYLGTQTGGATIGLDEERGIFSMHMDVWGGVPFNVFEAKLSLFIRAVRWWKEWLALPPVTLADVNEQDTNNMIKV